MPNPCEIYKQIAKKYNIEVQECVYQALSQSPMLDLANQTLAVGTCAVLGKVLQSTDSISKASFEDCLLEEDGVKSILLGLCGNSSVKTLSLKGNNIQGNGTQAVVKMLRHNTGLTRLSLEWNNLGLCPQSFSALCDALASNTSVQYLDLRSNQLGPNTAVHLATLLSRNNTLTAIDLRWNGLGAAGGKTLLEGLHNNRTVKKLDLIGNNIPNDIISSYDQELAQHSRSAAVTQEYTNRSELLKQQLEQHEKYSNHQIDQLEQTVADTELRLKKSLRESTFQTGQLEESLRSKSLEVNALESKLNLTNSALDLSQERLAAMEHRAKTLEDQLQTSDDQARAQMTKDRDMLEHMREEHSELARSLQATRDKLESQVSELEFGKSNQKRQIFDLKEMICSLQSEVKGARAECEELMTSESGKHKEVIRTIEQKHNSELHKMRVEYDQVQSDLRGKLTDVETRRSEIEGDVTSLRVQISTERKTFHSQQTTIRHQLKSEHSAVMRGLEERIRAMEESRDDAEERLRGQVTSCSTLSASNSKLNTQMHTLKNQLAQLEGEVEAKADAVRSAETRVRDEVKHQIEELEQERTQTTKLNGTIAELQRSIAEKQLEYQNSCRKLEDDVRRAKMDKQQLEDELHKLKEDEVRRVGMLHTAFVSYFNTSPASPTKGTS